MQLKMSLGILALLPTVGAVISLELVENIAPKPVWWVAIGLPSGYLLVVVSAFIMSGLRVGPARLQAVAAVLTPIYHRPPWRESLWVLLAATGEELLFRVLGLWLVGSGAFGFALTSLVFATAHLLVAAPGRKIHTFFDSAVGGVVFASLYLATGGIATAVIAHFFRNYLLNCIRLGQRRLQSKRDEEGL